MTDEEIRTLKERRVPEVLTARTIRQVKRLEKVVDVLPKPKWSPSGERCPRCGRKLRKSVALVQSATFLCYWFEYTYWRCGPEHFYAGGCGYEYGKVETKVRKMKFADVVASLGQENGPA